jgi:hypothetical protein
MSKYKRLTTDNPQNNFEALMNYCYAKDGFATLRYAGGDEDIPLHEYTARCCSERGCVMTADEILEDGLMGCDCPHAVMYHLGSQATENNGRLKKYEDFGSLEEFAEPKNQWIPVSARLPEEYKMVLVWDGDNMFRAEMVNMPWHGIPDNTGFLPDSITHWRTMPKPPGGVDGDE